MLAIVKKGVIVDGGIIFTSNRGNVPMNTVLDNYETTYHTTVTDIIFCPPLQPKKRKKKKCTF